MQDEAVRAAGQLIFTLVGREDMKLLMARNNRAGLWQLAGHAVAILTLVSRCATVIGVGTARSARK